MPSGSLLVGRDPAAAVALGDPLVSRHHARLEIGQGELLVIDLGSKNGLWLGSRRLRKTGSLVTGDELRLGGTVLRLEAPGPARRAPRRVPVELPDGPLPWRVAFGGAALGILGTLVFLAAR